MGSNIRLGGRGLNPGAELILKEGRVKGSGRSTIWLLATLWAVPKALGAGIELELPRDSGGGAKSRGAGLHLINKDSKN